MTASKHFDGMDVEFENVKFIRATSLTNDTSLRLSIVIHIGSGNFEVSENTTAVMSGNVKVMESGMPIKDISKWIKDEDCAYMDTKDFYKELRLRGYHYRGLFKSIVEIRGDGAIGKIKWNNNWPAFMDCMLQVSILSLDSRSLYLPTSIRKIRINSEKHIKAVEALDPENPIMEVRMCKELGIVSSGGIEIEGNYNGVNCEGWGSLSHCSSTFF